MDSLLKTTLFSLHTYILFYYFYHVCLYDFLIFKV